MPVIGFLDATVYSGRAPFREGLAETGFVEGRNVARRPLGSGPVRKTARTCG
jgi:hypothetical protein